MDRLVPEGMTPEVASGTVLLDLADGTQVVCQVGKARWHLAMAEVEVDEGLLEPVLEPDPRVGALFGQRWMGIGFLPLKPLEEGVVFRLTQVLPEGRHYRLAGGPDRDNEEEGVTGGQASEAESPAAGGETAHGDVLGHLPGDAGSPQHRPGRPED